MFEDIAKRMHKTRENGLYLSDLEIEILEKYHVDYRQYPTMESLLLAIERTIQQEEIDALDLEELASTIAEYRYYHEMKR